MLGRVNDFAAGLPSITVDVYLVETLWKKSNPDKDINDWYSVKRLTPWTGCLFASICGVPRVWSALPYLDLSPRWGGRSKDNFLFHAQNAKNGLFNVHTVKYTMCICPEVFKRFFYKNFLYIFLYSNWKCSATRHHEQYEIQSRDLQYFRHRQVW